MTYYRTQKEKDEADDRLRKAVSNLPTTIDAIPSSRPPTTSKPFKKRRPHKSGYRLGDVIDTRTKDKLYAYKRRLESGKLR